MKYDKLVRDEIPDIIAESGKAVTYRILNDEDYKIALEMKLDEEVAEFHKNPSIEEIADIAEVLYALIEAYGYRVIDVINYRAAKREEKGGFDKGVYLEEVKDV
jgi:predicted house-cleaning noncanonical NTP pyrophosphatase (MazG superfamily)